MRPKLIFSNYKFRCPAKRAGPPLESKWKCEKIASIRAFVRMQREKEGYDISERADNYLNNPETRASSWKIFRLSRYRECALGQFRCSLAKLPRSASVPAM